MRKPALKEEAMVTAMLSVADVAARLKVSRYTVVRMIVAGKLAASKVGRQWRIDPTAVDEMLNRQHSNRVS